MAHLDLAATLADAGITVTVPDGLDPYTHQRSGAFTPVGIMNHHTVSSSRPRPDGCPSLRTVIDGRPGIPGPLCNLLVCRPRDGDVTVWFVSNGRANDSGTGNRAVLDLVLHDRPPPGDARTKGNVNGNRWFYDIEVENNGTGEPYAEQQLDVLVRINAAIARAKGWTANRSVHHREWTNRKIDMSWRGDLRGRTARLLAQEPAVTRISGPTRYATAVAVSRIRYADGAQVDVYLATGTDWPDSIGAVGLSLSGNGPVLLVEPDRLPQEVADELQRLDVQQILVVGGTGAVSDGVLEAARAAAGR